MTASDFMVLGIDAETVLQVYIWGLGSVVTMYFSGWVIGVAIDLVKKA